MENEDVPFTPGLFMFYYQQHLGRIIDGFQAMESMIDIIISVYFGNKGTTDDLITFLHHLNFEIKIDALRIVTTNKCPELIKDQLVTMKYLLAGNQDRDKFFKAIRSFKKLRNSIAHAAVKNINIIDFSKYSLPTNPPDIEFIVFEKPDQYNSEQSSYIKVHKILTKKALENIYEDYNLLHDIVTSIFIKLTGQTPP